MFPRLCVVVFCLFFVFLCVYIAANVVVVAAAVAAAAAAAVVVVVNKVGTKKLWQVLSSGLSRHIS